MSMNETFEEFSAKCLKQICPLGKEHYGHICLKDTKQKRCFGKKKKDVWSFNGLEIESDPKWQSLRLEILERDKSCKLWMILTPEEKNHILHNYQDEFFLFKKFFDTAHIIPKSVNKSLYYDKNNLVLIYRYFHRLLDQYMHPVYRTHISNIEREQILRKAFNHIV